MGIKRQRHGRPIFGLDDLGPTCTVKCVTQDAKAPREAIKEV